MATVWDLAHIELPVVPGGRRRRGVGASLGYSSATLGPRGAGDRAERSSRGPARERLPMPRGARAAGAVRDAESAGGARAAPARRTKGAAPPRASARRLFYPAQFWAPRNHTTRAPRPRPSTASATRRSSFVLVGSDKGTLDHVHATAVELGIEAERAVPGVHRAGRSRCPLYRAGRTAPALYLSFFGPSNLPPAEACALGCPWCAPPFRHAAPIGTRPLFAPPTDDEAIAQAVRRGRGAQRDGWCRRTRTCPAGP